MGWPWVGRGSAVGRPWVGRCTPGDGFPTPLFIHLDSNFKPAGSEKQHDSHHSHRRAESAVVDTNETIYDIGTQIRSLQSNDSNPYVPRLWRVVFDELFENHCNHKKHTRNRAPKFDRRCQIAITRRSRHLEGSSAS